MKNYDVVYAVLIALSVTNPAPAAQGGDFRVVYYYDRSKPLDTFRFKAYDLRKGEFTPAVERWLKGVKARFPNYNAYSRDVVLASEKGETEKLKVGAAIKREFLILGNAYGYAFIGAGEPRPAPRPGQSEGIKAIPSRPFSRSTRFNAPLAVSPPFSPFPYPYPRPHP